MPTETDFEKRRGVSTVEKRDGFAQIHVSRLTEPLMSSRLAVLRAVADADISLDFLKLTPSGLSCLISEQSTAIIEKALSGCGVIFSVKPGRSIVLAHAVNMRDEEGMIAAIVCQAIATGARVDHISDMHDRVLMVVHSDDAVPLRNKLEEVLVKGRSTGRS